MYLYYLIPNGRSLLRLINSLLYTISFVQFNCTNKLNRIQLYRFRISKTYLLTFAKKKKKKMFKSGQLIASLN